MCDKFRAGARRERGERGVGDEHVCVAVFIHLYPDDDYNSIYSTVYGRGSGTVRYSFIVYK